MRTGLERWATQLTWRRAAVLARRYLLVGLLIALVPALAVLAAGARRPFWLLAVLALAPLGAGVALTHRTPAARAARLFDRALGLHDQLGTAFELPGEAAQLAGLAVMVVDEARASLAQSFVTARVQTRRAPAEWAWVAVALCALVVLIALPRHTATTPGLPSGSNSASARAAATSGAQGQGRAAGRPAKASSPGGTKRTPALQQVPLTGGARAAYGVQTSRTTGERAPVDAKGTATVSGQHTQPGLAVSGGAGAAGRQTGSSQAATGADRTTTGASASARPGRAGAGTSKASSGSVGAHAGETSTTAGRAAGASASSQGRGSGGTPAGGTAGTGKAAPNAKLGLTPYTSGTGTTALPLQATFTPASTPHVSAREGASESTEGNGRGSGAGAHAGSAAGRSGTSGTDFSVIPSTSNASPPDQDLVQNYFGTANQLSFKGW